MRRVNCIRLTVACVMGGAFGMWGAEAAWAEDPGQSISIKRTMAKMQKFSDGLIPVPNSGAVIKVYGQNGVYEGIANISGNLTQPWDVQAHCRLGDPLQGTWIESHGVEKPVLESKDYDNLPRGYEERTVLVEIPVGQFDMQPDPVQACNAELATRAAESGMTRAQVQYWGFVLKYPDAVQATLKAKCADMAKYVLKPKSPKDLLGVPSYMMKKSASAPVYVACLPTQQPKPPTPKGGGAQPQPEPEPKPEIKKAKVVSPVQSVDFKLNTTDYQGKCPAPIKVDATITLNYPVEVKYRYVGDKGHKSPVFTLKKKDKGGTWGLAPWTRQVKPASPATKIAMPGVKHGADYQGWMQLEMISPVAKTWPPVNFKVSCHAPPPTVPGVLQTTPKPEPKTPKLQALPKPEPKMPVLETAPRPEQKTQKLQTTPRPSPAAPARPGTLQQGAPGSSKPGIIAAPRQTEKTGGQDAPADQQPRPVVPIQQPSR